MKLLHNKFLYVPIDKIDKTRREVACACQMHLAQVLINELDLNKVNTIRSTYVKAIKQVEKIVSDNISFLKIAFNLDVNEINNKLRNIYWTPKLHKNSTKARFIIAALKCSVKSFSNVISAAL